MGAESLARHVPVARARWRLPVAPWSALVELAAAGLALEAVLLLGFLLPLSLWRLPHQVLNPDQLATVFGHDATGALRFMVPVLCAFSLFAAALLIARRLAGRGPAWLVLGGTLLFSATLLPANPLDAHDVYHNVMDARILWVHGKNPTVTPPRALSRDPFFAYVPSWRDTPSAYGPVWYAIAGAPLPFTGARLWPNVLAQKAIASAFLFGTALLAMLLAERIRAGTGVMAGVLVGWNPLLQWEAAGNAHNDVVMVCFALAAIYALARRWYPLVFPLLALSIGTKETLAVLGPVLLVYMLARRSVSRRQIALSLGLGALVLLAVYAPLSAGRGMLDALQRESDHVTSSPGAFIYLLLQSRLHAPWSPVLTGMKLVAWPLFLAGYGWLLWRLWRQRDLTALGRTSFWSVLLLVALLTWWFMPWYLFWLVPLAALRPAGRAGLVAAFFSCSAMLAYAPHFWLLYRGLLLLEGTTAATAFLVPLLIAAAPRARPPRAGTAMPTSVAA